VQILPSGRFFLSLVSVFLASGAFWTEATLAAGLEGAGSAHPGVLADTLYFGGPIHTMEPVLGCGPEKRAVATRGDRVLWVGCLRHVPPIVGPATRRVELHGRTLLPGFVDAHSHMFGTAGDLAEFETRQALVIRNGITSQGELFANQNTLDRLIGFRDSGEMKVRTSVYLRWNNACGDVQDEWWQAYQPIHDPRAQLRMPGLKIFTDGGSCNLAAITVPYQDGTFGDLYLTAAQLAPMLRTASRLGWQVAIHSIGDRSRDEVFEALRHVPRALRPWPTRVEHDTIMRPDQVHRYTEVGAIPVVFGNLSTCRELDPDPAVSWHGTLGPSRSSWYRPTRDIVAKNRLLPVAWKLDKDGIAGDGNARPMAENETTASIYALVTRRQVDTDGTTVCMPPPDMLAQAVPAGQVLRMMTRNAAFVLGTSSVVGSLRAGKYADLVVLSGDPLSVASADLKDLFVAATVIGGEALYCAPGHDDLCP
jgi:predicted amidohydrolase YtcJ